MRKPLVIRRMLICGAILAPALFGYFQEAVFSSPRGVQEGATGTIYFTTYYDYTYYFYMMRADGEDQRLLVESNRAQRLPSPDGKYLALAQHRSGTLVEGKYDLCLVDLQQDRLIRLTDTGDNYSPTWAPSGEKMAFFSHQLKTASIWVVSVNDNFLLTRLVEMEGYGGFLEWSSDGTFLSFRLCDDDSKCKIVTINPEGTPLTDFTPNPSLTIHDLALSPDNTSLALIGEEESSLKYAEYDIYILDLNHQTLSKITDTSADYGYLEWDSQGERLAYASNKDGDWDVYITNYDDLHTINLTNYSDRPDGINGLDWSPDDHYLAFTSPDEGDFEIYTIGIDGSNLTQLTNNEVHDLDPIWTVTNEAIP